MTTTAQVEPITTIEIGGVKFEVAFVRFDRPLSLKDALEAIKNAGFELIKIEQVEKVSAALWRTREDHDPWRDERPLLFLPRDR